MPPWMQPLAALLLLTAPTLSAAYPLHSFTAKVVRIADGPRWIPAARTLRIHQPLA